MSILIFLEEGVYVTGGNLQALQEAINALGINEVLH